MPRTSLPGLFACLATCLAFGLADPAQAMEPATGSDAPASPLHFEWTQGPGGGASGSAPYTPYTPYGPATVYGPATQTMLWAARGRVAVGLGVEQRGVAPAGYPVSPGLVGEREGQWLLGVSLRTSLQTRLVWQVPTTYNALPGALPDGTSAPRLSLDWGHPDPYKGLLRGSLRFELARDTTVSIKPRGGHWSLALSSKW